MNSTSLFGGNSDFNGRRVAIKFRHGEITIGGHRLVGTITEVIQEKNGAFILHLDGAMHLSSYYRVDDILVVGVDMNPLVELFGQSERSLGLPIQVGVWRIRDEDARNRARSEERPPQGEFLGRGEAFVAGTDLSPEALRFADATKIPNGLKLESSDKGFFEAFNEIFGFHDARVVSNALSWKSRSLDLLLNYVVGWSPKEGHYELMWRKMLLKFEDVSSVEFGWRDPELGFPHHVKEEIDLMDIDKRSSDVIQRLEKDFHSDLAGAELNAIIAQRFGSQALRFEFD